MVFVVGCVFHCTFVMLLSCELYDCSCVVFFFFQAKDGIRDLVRSRGLGDVYKRQVRYLPVELRAYGGDFDRHGSWGRYGSYGWVWYPRVSVGWQPYRTGRWSFVVNFGYSWIGGSRWEWPTHHYGRWERGGSWGVWVPQRPVQALSLISMFGLPRPC